MIAHRVRLEIPKRPAWRGGGDEYYARESLPFVESAAGTYTHRVRSLTLHVASFGSHYSASASCWCGMSLCIGGKRHRYRGLVAMPSEGRFLCATCEGRAIGAGQLGAREIAGRPVIFSPRRIKVEIEL